MLGLLYDPSTGMALVGSCPLPCCRHSCRLMPSATQIADLSSRPDSECGCLQESTVTTMAADAVPILLKGCAKLMYTATLHVGDQYLDAVIDTGSSNLVLMGAECLGCSDTPRYIIQWHPLESLLAVCHSQ